MHSALVIVEPPAVAGPEGKVEKLAAQKWDYFLTGPGLPEAVQKIPNDWRLHAGCWQIPLENGLPTLLTLLTWCHQCKMPSRVLFLKKEPKWMVNNPSS
jgi:hypothetical protein